MTTIKEPPIYQPMIDPPDPKDPESFTGIATLAWILFFNQLFIGDTGTSWTPTFTNLTVVGAAPTITGVYYKISQSLVYFRAKIVPGTNTSSTAGTTYINNFPLSMIGDGACIAVSGLLGGTPGMCDQASNNIYVPAWTTVTVPLSIVGIVEAR